MDKIRFFNRPIGSNQIGLLYLVFAIDLFSIILSDTSKHVSNYITLTHKSPIIGKNGHNAPSSM